MRIKIHVHQPGSRVKSFDAFTQVEIDDLIDRLTAILESQQTQDDGEGVGHPFHGNQYVTVAGGPKPTSHTSKTVKAGVAQLLASGHHFSMEELVKATGAKLPQQIHNALAELKKATPPGGLMIAKEGGVYKVVKAANVAVPESALEPKPALTPIPEPIAPPEPVSAPPGATGGGVIKAPATKLTKEAADAKYQSELDKTMGAITTLSKSEMAEEAPQLFKNGKANLMAQWKADTTGEDQTVKPQEVFEADKHLIKSLAEGVDAKTALFVWKQNTAAEKAGNFPPKQAINPKPSTTPALPKEESVEHHEPAFEPVTDYVPKDHVPVGADDFDAKLGNSQGVFAKQLSSLKSSLSAGHPDAVQNKLGVQKALEERLAKSPAFQALQKQTKSSSYGGSLSLAAKLISAWAGSSGDHQPISVANQISVREAFKMDPSKVSQGNMSKMHQSAADDEVVFEQAAKSLGLKYQTTAEKATFKAGMRDFALAQYHNTQDHLAQLGIKEVYVVRGMHVQHSDAGAVEANIKLQPASSFSANYSTANGSFGSGGTTYLCKVPASQVLSSYVTGFGCSNEHEVVVLAHPDLKAVRFKSQAAGSMSAATDHIRATLPGSKGSKPSPSAQTNTPAPAPVKKNAHYYKKLKEKVVTHPQHNEATYSALKSIGHSNEKILEHYHHIHEKQFGQEPA